MYLYNAFGINIESEILIPQFSQTANNQIDVSIKYGKARPFLPSNVKNDPVYQVSENEICFFWDLYGTFLVRNGNEIVVDTFPGADEQLLRLPLIGTVLAALLQQRGLFVLHASAVSINNEAIAFLGWKGAGKSTMAAMLYERGHTMISDDIVAIKDINTNLPTVIPGFPNFKLMPETATTVLGDELNSLSFVYPGLEKRFRSCNDNFSKKNLPLKAIYSLYEGDEINFQLLNPQESLTTLIANSYLARYGKQLFKDTQAKTNLRQCASIINQVPVYRLERPKSFQLMNELSNLLETHLSAN